MARLSVTLSPEMEALIQKVSSKRGISRAQAVRRAFALLQISEEQMENGRELGIIKDEGGEIKAVGKIAGLKSHG
ncbi:TPA: ribbon-helix-helix protein, CopG family [Klebsiella variicola subsp. variicola]|uniref:ribbon-helix-helix protein, CopG family n=1 Tax=Klebsiella sp. GL120222-02 TaxID=1378085 RepID=UPI000E30D6EC|nr:ribbon-helix-helix protein, CopG family [Klebsiella sp. GL120222-02]HCI5685034.1 ribbon-helix-helix protein, CopG family [Klebsiella variicola subsp. variicola]HCI6296650.1 ribbon-helix-helix protein, CopG family [Klebsiella variicola subsp. variicola]